MDEGIKGIIDYIKDEIEELKEEVFKEDYINNYNVIIYDEENEEIFNENVKARDVNGAVKIILEFCKLHDGDTIEVYKGD